ncbi:P1 family peptidase [Halobacillus sp. A5]|uniref:DmpA family aminopeptidase n=1 Tax=Halobacillus sp. A5 TaxID=2880263 RepID=UPI0020A6B74A|nr:P1 family peptidase [Halobacillus sp. A5]MCP3027278.1 P1 family peptidase [Halobacillus sp. A5]
MSYKKRTRDYGVIIGELPTGKQNLITDVDGVTVGQVTLDDGEIQTGVSAILPHQGNLFQEKVMGASHIINGFGKTIGTVQLDELGTIEAPIVLTNTLSVGTAASAVIDYTLQNNEEVGRTTGTVNPVAGECNDMVLNDIRKQSITKRHVLSAIKNASSHFEEGSVGAGRGMLCYSLKGGVGSSSRLIELPHGTYTLGVYAVSNFGTLKDLTINGRAVGRTLTSILKEKRESEKGSIMLIAATDLPLTERQLKRILKRSVVGLTRTGSIISNGSGDIVIGFSTAVRIPHEHPDSLLHFSCLHEEDMDLAFRAIGEASEEAVLNSLFTATHIIGRNQHDRPTLSALLEKYEINL